LEDQLNMYNIESQLSNIQYYPMHNDIECIDELITRVLNIARKKAEGIK